MVTPHQDVASGRYQQAEFAADLWQAHLGEGTDEYRDPAEFFRRTYLTESLKGMLTGAVQRLTGGGGDPVVQLQTNFGGGKTHSMLALYHLCAGVAPERDRVQRANVRPAVAAGVLARVAFEAVRLAGVGSASTGVGSPSSRHRSMKCS